LTPTPIRQVLSTFQTTGVRTLLMGGQACVFYGAAQDSKDINFLVLADQENFVRLEAALAALQASRIAVPPFDPAALVLTAVENGGAGRSKTTALGGVDISSFVGVSRPL